MKLPQLLGTGVTGLLLVIGSLDMPDTGDPASPPSMHVSPRYIEDSYRETAVPNMVTAVLADYRGFDTLRARSRSIFTGAAGQCMLILRVDARGTGTKR